MLKMLKRFFFFVLLFYVLRIATAVCLSPESPDSQTNSSAFLLVI